jgi:hypothetical protein
MWRRVGIEQGEGRLFAWAASTLFLLGWAYVSVTNVSEVFFIKRIDVRYLPLAFLVSSAVLVVTTLALGRLAVNRSRVRMLPVVLLGLGLVLIPLWLAVESDLTPVLGLLVIVSKQIQALGLLIFLLALGDLLHPRQAKRLFAPLMAGMTLGTMLGSFASEPLGRWLGIDALLPISTAVLAGAALMAIPLRRGVRRRLGGRGESDEVIPTPVVTTTPSEEAGFGSLWRESRLFRLLALTTLASGLLGPMLYFQFQYVADLATRGEGGEGALLRILAWFRGSVSFFILFTQLGLTGVIYRRIGLPLAAAISPGVYLLGFVGVAASQSLPAGVGGLAGAKFVDNAIYDPALRVLYNLFREGVRSQAVAFLEGPVKRGGGVVGNLLTQALILGVGPFLVPWVGLVLAGGWMAVALVLWRLYPSLLMGAVNARGAHGFDHLPLEELLDPATERVLARQLLSSDPQVVRLAIDLCSAGSPERAVAALAKAAREAPDETRSLLVDSLDRLLEASVVASEVTHAEAARDLGELLAQPGKLEGIDRANVVQAYGRLTHAAQSEHDRELLERARAERSPGVRLAARVALARRGDLQAGDLLPELGEAATGPDPVARQIAREELRALLVEGDPETDPNEWAQTHEVLLRGLARADERAAIAQGLADVAERHPDWTAAAREPMLALLEDPDSATRAAAMRFVGAAGMAEVAKRLVGAVDAEDEAEAIAACRSLRALGPAAADVLLVELSYGRRSRRDTLLRLVGELEVEEQTLLTLYERELDALHRTVLNCSALRSRASSIVIQRLEERIGEGLHTTLLLLAALHREESIAQLAEHLKRTPDPRRRAILLEALEALLPPDEKRLLLPLLEDSSTQHKAARAAERLGIPIPSSEIAARDLEADSDELTRMLFAATGLSQDGEVAGVSVLDDARGTLKPVEIALSLRRTPLFERLSTRHLVDIAGAVHQERHSAGTVLFHEGDLGTSMFLIVDGRIRIQRGTQDIAVLGPEEFFGEMGLLEAAPRTATALCDCDVQLLRLERDELLALMEELPAIAIGVAQQLSRRYRTVLEQIPA